MADILIDVEVKGNQKVVAAVNSTKSLESNVKALSAAMTKGSLSQRQYYKGISQLAESSGKSERQLRDYATAIRRVEKESKAAKAAQQQEAAAIKAYTQARREATAANQRYDAELKQKARAEEEAARAAAKHASEMEQIKNKYVPLYAASKQYERAIEELNQAYVKGALTQGQYLAAMNSIDAQLANSTARAKGNTRSMSGVGMAVQQTGYQVGDFLVQVQGGTNAMVAFGQQATQLVGVLPMLAERLGVNVNKLVSISAVLGIVIPLATAVGAAIMRTSGSGKTLTDTIDELSKATGDYRKQAELASQSTNNLSKSFGKQAANIRGLSAAMQEVLKLQAIDQLNSSLDRLGETLNVGMMDSLRGFSNTAEGQIRKVMHEFELTDQQAQMLITTFQGFKDAEGIDGAVNSAKSLHAMLLQVFGSAEKIPTELRDAFIQSGLLAQSAAEMNEEISSSSKLAETFKSTMESITIDNLLSQMSTLNSQLGSAIFGAGTMSARLRGLFDAGVAAAENAAYAQEIGGGRSMGRGGPTAEEIQNYDPRAQIAYTPGGAAGIPLPKIKGSSGGGSGGAAKVQEDYLAKLQQEADRKLKLIGLSEEETRRQEIIFQLQDKKLPVDEKRIEAILKTEEALRLATEAEQQREQMMQTITSNIESAFMTVVDGSKSVEDAFRGMLRNIILAIYQQQVAKPAATAIGSLISGIIPSFDGGGFTGYGPRSGGLDGKGGSLAMIHPNETVVDHTKGQSMGSVVVNNNFNISANGDESVKRIIRGEVPRITEATKAAVLDAKRRGGSYGRAF